MSQLDKFCVLDNAWYPALASHEDAALVAWRDFDRERPVLASDRIQVAPLYAGGPGEAHTVVEGLFVDGPRPIRLAEGWGLLAVRRQDKIWRLECHHLNEDLSPGSVETVSSGDRSVIGFSAAGSRKDAFVVWIALAD
jgi:hypothetical protein